MCSLQPYVVLFLIAFNKYLLLNLYKSLFFIIYRSKQLVPKKTHQSNVDKKLQEQFQLMLTVAENIGVQTELDKAIFLACIWTIQPKLNDEYFNANNYLTSIKSNNFPSN